MKETRARSPASSRTPAPSTPVRSSRAYKRRSGLRRRTTQTGDRDHRRRSRPGHDRGRFRVCSPSAAKHGCASFVGHEPHLTALMLALTGREPPASGVEERRLLRRRGSTTPPAARLECLLARAPPAESSSPRRGGGLTASSSSSSPLHRLLHGLFVLLRRLGVLLQRAGRLLQHLLRRLDRLLAELHPDRQQRGGGDHLADRCRDGAHELVSSVSGVIDRQLPRSV